MFSDINAVRIHVSIDDIEPEAWRRLVLPSHWTLEQLHLAIQAAFNWWDYHLHEFEIGGLTYGDVESLTEYSAKGDPNAFDSSQVRLRDFRYASVFTYIYDFGDNWRHSVIIEEFLALDIAPRYGTCIDGARARPPEDVGGVSGYERFLEIMADKADPEHADTRHWCGGHFDPEWFDLAMVTRDVRNALRPSAKRRLHQPRPRRKVPGAP